MTKRVLVVEDAASFRKAVSGFLRRHNYEVYEAWSLNSARRLLPSVQPQILLLDIELEDGDSHDLLREAAGRTIPTIVISVRDQASERVTALQLGAEDYMVKPIDFSELRLRMQRLSKSSGQEETWRLLDFGSFVLDVANRSIMHSEGPAVDLSPSEFQLLRLFMSVGDKVLTRETIARRALGRSALDHSRAVDVLVSKLRRKLDPTGRASLIWSVRGEGYRFAAKPKTPAFTFEDIDNEPALLTEDP